MSDQFVPGLDDPRDLIEGDAHYLCQVSAGNLWYRTKREVWNDDDEIIEILTPGICLESNKGRVRVLLDGFIAITDITSGRIWIEVDVTPLGADVPIHIIVTRPTAMNGSCWDVLEGDITSRPNTKADCAMVLSAIQAMAVRPSLRKEGHP